MKSFLKDIWACWKSMQEERARWYAKHGGSWE